MSNSLLLFLTLINMVPFINSLGTHLTPAGLSEELATVNNSSILHDVHPYPDSVFVPVSYCYEKFGHDYTPYPAREAFQGITGWIVPLLVLVGNMYMPHFATTSLTVFHFFAVTGHLLADPIDSIYSLGIKLRMRRMIYYTICTIRQADPALEHTMDDEVVGQLRTILFALHDYLGTDPVHPSTIATLIQGWNNNPIAVCRAADRLKDHRVKNTRRVVLAIAVYIASLVTAWERTKNDPPLYFLHTIALRELYYWLLPAIVLSCMAGGFPTDKTVKWVLEDNDLALTLGLRDQKFQPWNGGTYSFAVDRSMDLPKFWLLVLAFLAVGFAWASAFAMSWISPTKGLECRGMLQLTYLGTWVINCGVNWGLYAVLKWIMGWNEGRLRRWKLSWLVGNTEDRLRRWWICVMSKDIFLGAAMLGILLGAFKGWFNRCYCYGAVPGLKGDAFVDLNMKERVKHLAQLICPLMILLALALQALVLVAMLFFIRYLRPSLRISPAPHQSIGDDQLHGGFSGGIPLRNMTHREARMLLAGDDRGSTSGTSDSQPLLESSDPEQQRTCNQRTSSGRGVGHCHTLDRVNTV